MIQFNLPLTADSTMLPILIAAVVLVFSLHFYLRRLIGKAVRVVPVPAIGSAEARRAAPVADEPHANIKR